MAEERKQRKDATPEEIQRRNEKTDRVNRAYAGETYPGQSDDENRGRIDSAARGGR